MIIGIPVTDDGLIGHTWGKAPYVAIATTGAKGIDTWTVHEVRWDLSHDAGSHGAHHAKVVTFLREQRVDTVVVDHVGEGMARMLQSMGVALVTGASGEARAAVLAVARNPGRD